MRIVKIISIILAVLLAAGVAVMLNNDSRRVKEEQSRAEELETSLRALRVELNRLRNELDRLQREYNGNIRGTGTVTLLYLDTDAAIYDAVCPGMAEAGYSGAIAIPPGAFPGEEGCLSLARFRDLISSGWSWCVKFPEDSETPDEDVRALLKHAEELGFEPTTVIFFPENCYSTERDEWAASLGFDIMIHHGEEEKIMLVDEAGTGVWYPGALHWRSTLRRVYLAAATDECSHFVLELNFKDDNFDSYVAYHDTLLKAMDEYLSKDYLQIMNPKQARQYRAALEAGADDETVAYKKKCDAINEQIRLVEQEIEQLYFEHSMEQNGK